MEDYKIEKKGRRKRGWKSRFGYYRFTEGLGNRFKIDFIQILES